MLFEDFIHVDRVVPQLPPRHEKLKIILDTDFANEIDDLYAAALLITSTDRFDIKGFVATHFNHFNHESGPYSIDTSFNLLKDFMKIAGLEGKYPIVKGAHPMMYYGYPSEGDGVDFIIQTAHTCSAENPLWVVGLGASTNLASALLKDPSITDKVRYVFHSRSEHAWPNRSFQFNIRGDIHAARTLLKKWVPLVWFDTGTYLCCDYAITEKYLASYGELGSFLHHYRDRCAQWKDRNKGFFDLGDIAWMLEPDICRSEVVYAPTMDEHMFFNHEQANGKMLRIYDIDNDATWNMLFESMRRCYGR